MTRPVYFAHRQGQEIAKSSRAARTFWPQSVPSWQPMYLVENERTS
jgi:hypothetical protein